MYHNDNGYFEYDDNYAPLCIKFRHDNALTNRQAMLQQTDPQEIMSVLQAYYHDIRMYGRKHELALQPSGISAAEAALFLVRGKLNKQGGVTDDTICRDVKKIARKKNNQNSNSSSSQEEVVEYTLKNDQMKEECKRQLVLVFKEQLSLTDNHSHTLQQVLQLPHQYYHELPNQIIAQVKTFIRHYSLCIKRYTKILKSTQPMISTIIKEFYGIACI